MEMKRIKGPNHRGVRLHHPDLRNCTFTIEQQNRIYPVPYECAVCNKTHIFKTFHLHLNQEGDVTVHEGIYELFKSEGIISDLKAAKEVTPRPIVLDMGRQDQPLIVVSHERGPVKLPGMNGHGRT